MPTERSDGTVIHPRGGANFRCPKCNGLTSVKTTWGGVGQVIRERRCTVDSSHRFFTTEHFEVWRSEAVLERRKKKPYRLRRKDPELDEVPRGSPAIGPVQAEFSRMITELLSAAEELRREIENLRSRVPDRACA